MIAAAAPISPSAVAEHYDELDYFYRDVWGEHVHHGLWLHGDEPRDTAVAQLVAQVAAAAGLQPGDRVCDIGCGYGATARMLAARWQANVTGITISPAQYRFACEQIPLEEPKPRYRLGDWLENDFPSASFDAAIAIESSEHMPDLRAFFLQAHRTLRPGGRLVICAWLSADSPAELARRWLLEPICREGRMPQMGTAHDYEKLAHDAGLIAENFADLTRQVARTWPMIVAQLGRKLLSNPSYLRFLFNRHATNRIFTLTVLRIWLAYRTGAMRYGIFTFRREG